MQPGGPEWLRRCAGEKAMHVFDRISRVNLIKTGVTDAGLVCLRGMTTLNELDLDGTSITDAGLAHLGGLTNLKMLYLNETGVTDAGLVHVSRLTKLESLWLLRTRVSEKRVAMLQKTLPGCAIIRSPPSPAAGELTPP